MAQLSYSSIDWITVLWGGIGIILGSQLGVILSQKIPGKVIIQMLSIFVNYHRNPNVFQLNK